MVRSGNELARVREIQIQSDQESRLLLRRIPYLLVGAAEKVFVTYGMNVTPKFSEHGGQASGKIFVELGFHRKRGVAATGRSSSAEAAAKAIAARMSSAAKLGKSARMVSAESPAAQLARTVRRVTRVPLNLVVRRKCHCREQCGPGS
jgi:hypothetical protein